MVNQILIASGMVGVCEALLYGYRRAGLDLDTVLQSVINRGRGVVEPEQPRSPDDRGKFRARVSTSSTSSKIWGSLAEARRMKLSLPGLALGRSTLSSRGGPGACSVGHPCFVVGPGSAFLRRLGNHSA